jgi:uncharacterized membrane protein YdfJ with MMPL/SSD domain
MTGPLYALGALCARHRLAVLIPWLLVAVVLAIAARGTGQQTSDNLVLPGTDSQNATDVLSNRFPDQANGTNPVTLRAPQGHKLTESPYKSAIDGVVTDYKKDPAVLKVVSPFSSGPGQLKKDASIGFISLTLKDSPSELSVDEANQIIDVADPAKAAGVKVAAGGYLGQKVSKPSSHTSVRERWQATGDAHVAVIEGLAGTARVITSAALIMVGVFCAFIINGDPNIKQFGLGMAAAVAVDATVVRCLLVPAVMSLVGRAGWWLPGWLDRGLPRLSIEGDEYFAERDAAAAAAAERAKVKV